MNLFFIIPYVPNAVRVRSYQLIRSLLERGNRITLATLPVEQADEADLAHLRGLGVRVLAQPMAGWRSLFNSVQALPSQVPLQAVYSFHPRLLQTIQQELQNNRFDAIHIEHLRGSQYGVALKQLFGAEALANQSANKPSYKRGLPPIVWDSVDCITYLFAQATKHSSSLKSRLMTRLELNRTRRHEGRLVQTFERTLVTSAIDKNALEMLAAEQASQLSQRVSNNLLLADKASRHGIEVIANGVDLSTFTYVNGVSRPAARIVFSGKMSYHANATAAVHLVENIMPTVWARRPEAEVWIVGKDPTPEVCKLATHGVTVQGEGGQPSQRKVVVTGTVPDLPQHLRQATVAVAPLLYGAGIQNKVLEAMASGAPVIASKQASAALAARHGRELFVAETPSDFAQALLHLLDTPTLRSEVGEAGRRFVESEHTWSGAALRLEELYRSAGA